MWASFVGFAGSGKSTVVRRLQQTTGRVVCDLHGEIARRAGHDPLGIWKREGEAAYLELALEALRELAEGPALLLEVGGGCVASPAIAQLLRRRGVVYWLDAPWEVLRERLRRAEAGRHFLAALTDEEGLRDLFARWLRAYAAAADFRLRTDRLTPEEVAQTVLLRGLIWRRRRAEARS